MTKCVVITLSFVLFLSTAIAPIKLNAKDDRWKHLAGSAYYDSESIIRKMCVAKIWVKYEAKASVDAGVVDLALKDKQNLIEIRCMNRLSRILTTVYHYHNAPQKREDYDNPQWINIEPESIEDAAYNVACKGCGK